MPSIKQKFYGIIRQFSSNTVVVGSQDDDGDEVAVNGVVNMQNNSVLLMNHHVMVEGGSQGGSTISAKKPSSLSTNKRESYNGSDKGNSPASPTEHSFIYRYLTGRLKKPPHPEIYYGKTGVDLPVLHLRPLNNTVVASYSGPDGGLTRVPPVRKRPMANIANLDDELNLSFDADCISETGGGGSSSCNSSGAFSSSALCPPPTYFSNGHKYNLADSDDASSTASSSERHLDENLDWTNFTDRAYGLSTSLYECNPLTKVHAGNPIADVFAVCARQNNCILALADGVNWGEKSRLAARCAIRGAVEQLNESMFNGERNICTTLDVFHCLLGAFHAGHHLILQEGGALTTLCVVVLCPLKDAVHWVACACNVGDSLAFVFSQNYGVREITLGSHDIEQMRDMRDAGGALGPVDGVNPELHNMTCSMTIVDPGDIVFITSDGVSDNFDPVVGKFCLIRNTDSTASDKENGRRHQPTAGLAACKSPPMDRRRSSETNGKAKMSSMDSEEDQNGTKIEINLPMVEAYQRHELMLLRMEDLLRNGVTIGDRSAQSSKDLCENLVNFSTQLTMAKRKILEDPELYQGERKSSKGDQRHRRKLVRQKISEMPGKLDHATVVAYCVGEKYQTPIADDSSATTPEYDDRNNTVLNLPFKKINPGSLESDENETLDTPTPRRHQQAVAEQYDVVMDIRDCMRPVENSATVTLPIRETERIFDRFESIETNLLSNFIEDRFLKPLTTDDAEEDSHSRTADEEDEILLEEFFDTNSSVVSDENWSKNVQNGHQQKYTVCQGLSTIHEASSNSSGRQMLAMTSFDSDTLLVVYTSDGHTTVPSSEIDSYAISPPSIVEACLDSTAINTSVAVTMAPDLSIGSARSIIADPQRTAAALTVSTCSSTAFSNDIASDDVFDSDAAKILPGVHRPVKGRDGGDDGPYNRMLNQSYYLATSQEEFLPQGMPIGNKQDSFDSQAPPTKQPPPTRFKKLSKTWERFERAVPSFRKAKKHPRGSPQRHTVAVDRVQWQEYKNDKLPSRLQSDSRADDERLASPGSPKRTPSLHIPWSPIRSLKFFKTFTSPRHSMMKETLREDKVCPKPLPQPQPANPAGCSLDANASMDLKINSVEDDEKYFHVSHSASDSQIARGAVRLESTV